jgi:hypothetical protein
MITSEGKTMFTFADAVRGTRRPLMVAVGLAAALTLSSPGFAQAPAVALRTVPNALLSIDQNRSTVVERIVGEWGGELGATNAGITVEQLRTMLLGMRADHLLAASVAGSLEGLRKVVASSLVGSAPAHAKVSTKALGDAADDLVYTPVVPCRIVDSRNVGGVFGTGETRNYHAYLTSGTFAPQGGAASNCAIPANPAAVALNLTVVSAGANNFLTAWPFNTTRPLASTLNYAAGQVVANGALIPLCQPSCAADFSVFASGVDLIVDIVGYFAMPIATALQCTQVATTPTTIAVSADTLVGLPSCTAGYTRTGSNCAGTAGVPGGYLLETNAAGCLFRNLSSVTTYTATATSTCCRVPGR